MIFNIQYYPKLKKKKKITAKVISTPENHPKFKGISKQIT
jgi:hypothetical protein